MTIQEKLENVLSKMTNETVEIIGLEELIWELMQEDKW